MNQKHFQSIFRTIAKVNLIVENVIQMKSGIKDFGNLSEKNPIKYHVWL